jgi:peptidoglycan/xylan/chitin deacetylase (PgdA/CDA1 family)
VSLLALTYHDVIPLGHSISGFVGLGSDRFKLTQTHFAEHLSAVASSAVTVALVTDTALRSPRRLFLTFDDGGTSASTTIAPMLADLGWRGHFFVVTSQIGASGFLGPEAVRELRAAGHVVGSHSHTHPDLTRVPALTVSEEWKRSRAILEDLLGEPVEVASVPTGSYTDAVGRAAAEAGFSKIFTSEPWLKPRVLGGDGTAYGRFSVISTTPAERIASLCRLSRAAVWREASVWYSRKAAKRALGPVYARLREPLLARLPKR